MTDDNFSSLARKMVQKIDDLKYRYPDTFKLVEDKENHLREKMSHMQQQLAGLPQKQEALLTLYVINEIHKAVDQLFVKEWE